MLRLSALLLVLVAAPAAAQGVLTASPNPYDGSSLDVPLVLRNDGAATVTLDSLGFRSRYTRWTPFGLAINLFEGDGSFVTTLDCTLSQARACDPGGVPLPSVVLGDSLIATVFTYCSLCRGERTRAGGHFPDTLLVWTSGQPTPAEVVVTDAYNIVSTEVAPPGRALGLSVAPLPARGTAMLHLTLAEAAVVRVTVLDALGRTALRFEQAHPPGEGRVPLPLTGVSPGVYVVRAEAGGAAATARLVVSR